MVEMCGVYPDRVDELPLGKRVCTAACSVCSGDAAACGCRRISWNRIRIDASLQHESPYSHPGPDA